MSTIATITVSIVPAATAFLSSLKLRLPGIVSPTPIQVFTRFSMNTLSGSGA